LTRPGFRASVVPKDAVDKLNAQYADIQNDLTICRLCAGMNRKRMDVWKHIGRFRWTGDVRVRGEDFFQGYSGCTPARPQPGLAFRVRFGFEWLVEMTIYERSERRYGYRLHSAIHDHK